MEAFSIEDNGEMCFNIYCYNVQPGITINYATGDSSRPANEQTSKPSKITPPPISQPEESVIAPPKENVGEYVFVHRTGSKFHSHSICSNMKNPTYVTKAEVISQGYDKCNKCW